MPLSILGKYICFFENYSSRQLQRYIIAAPIEVKGKKSGDRLWKKTSLFDCWRERNSDYAQKRGMNLSHETESDDIQYDPI